MKLEAMIRRLYTGCGGHVDFTSVTDYETKVNKNISQSVEKTWFVYLFSLLVGHSCSYLFLICLSDSTLFNLEKRICSYPGDRLQWRAFCCKLGLTGQMQPRGNSASGFGQKVKEKKTEKHISSAFRTSCKNVLI